jgi:hypothetical protein
MKTALLIVVSFTPALALAQPLPQPKVGNTRADTARVVATARNRGPAAVPKRGQCPANWTQSGNYCIEMGGADLLVTTVGDWGLASSGHDRRHQAVMPLPPGGAVDVA